MPERSIRLDTKAKVNWNILALARFLFAMIVMFVHLNGFADTGFLKFYTYFGSFEAILGFLLISGFSIGNSILKNKKDYFLRRLQRIYPVYIISLLYQLFAGNYVFNSYFIFVIILNLLFLNQLVISYSLVGPAWTLSTEVWLYCLAPLFLKMNSKWLTGLILVSFGSFILYTCGRTLYHLDYYSTTNYGINLIILAFIWLAGFRMAVFSKEKKLNNILLLFLLGTYIIMTIAIQVLYRFKHNQVQDLLGTDILNFAGIFLCLAFAYGVVAYNNKMPRFSKNIGSIFNFLGNISYPLYLSHLSTFMLLKKTGASGSLMFFISAMLVAFLIYFVFDFYSKKRVYAVYNQTMPDQALISSKSS